MRISNRGTHALAAEGPGRCLVASWVAYQNEGETGGQSKGANKESTSVETTPLPDLLMPGQTLPGVVRVPVPKEPGDYRVSFQMSFSRDPRGDTAVADAIALPAGSRLNNGKPSGMMGLHVEDRSPSWGGFAPLVEEIRKCLVEASRLQKLPDDYTDITEGRLAKWKRWIKRKLLGNFKHAYVDVLSRQQSRFNQQVLTVLTELADYCATLEHATKARDQRSEVRGQGSEASDHRSEVGSL